MPEVIQKQTSPMHEQTQGTNKLDNKSKETKIMEQRLNGIMFHLFYKDFFNLLGLQGFSNYHEKQKKEEEESLNCLKDKYMKKFHKLPILAPHGDNKYWQEYSNLIFSDLSNEQICELVKTSMNKYYEWEQETLKKFIEWNEIEVAKEVMKEIDMITYIMELLDDYGYNYENIMYLSKKIN